MAGAEITFGGLDILGLSDSTTDVTYGDARWICQNSSNDDQKTFAVVQNCNGDELKRDAGHDNRNEISATYRWNDNSGLGAAPAIAKVGYAVTAGYLVTGWTIDTSNDDFPTITFTAHNHDTQSHDTSDTFATYSLPSAAPDLQSALTGAFGAVDFLVASDTGSSGAAAASGSITFECDHEDVMNAVGEELAGQNYNGRISISQTYNGAPDAVDTAAVYNVTSSSASRENTAFETVSYSAELGVTQDT